MDKLCAELAAWLSGLEHVPIVFAAYHQTRSQNKPNPYLGLCYQDGEVCPWWDYGGTRYAFPPHHLAMLSAHAGSNSAPLSGNGGLWVCTFELPPDGPLGLFDDWSWAPRPVRQQAPLIHAFRQTAKAYLRRGPTRQLHLKAAVLHLFAIVLDDWAETEPHEILTPVLELLHTDYSNPQLSLPDLAAAASLSIHHFGRVFRQEFGVTPMHYLRDIRLRQAKALLATTDLRISDIAIEVGYRDPLHFSRLFRQASGVSPRQWRRE